MNPSLCPRLFRKVEEALQEKLMYVVRPVFAEENGWAESRWRLPGDTR